ncbi:MAG TPA: ROK family protein [Gemmataceae bacterium]|nr:ROK family protein [Gemmataceae bacterium]
MYLGIEIGGTKLQLGLGEGDGVVAGLWRGRVDVQEGPEGIRRQITAAVPELLAKAGVERSRLRGVGIGFGGPVDDATHTVIKSHQIEGWDDFPLADWISDLLDSPAVLGNDADVAGLAEALFGAGKGLSPIFYITIGSGIGGGLIINGEIYRGCGRGAAEIGHMTFFNGEGFCTLESVASGWGIAERVRELLGSDARHRRSLLVRLVHGDLSRLTAEHVARAAQEGDLFARQRLGDTWDYLAEAIRNVLALLCPRRIVIGGGVALMGEELLFAPLRKLVADRAFKPFAKCYDIVPAALGEEVVVHGALALARKRLGG